VISVVLCEARLDTQLTAQDWQPLLRLHRCARKPAVRNDLSLSPSSLAVEFVLLGQSLRPVVLNASSLDDEMDDAATGNHS